MRFLFTFCFRAAQGEQGGEEGHAVSFFLLCLHRVNATRHYAPFRFAHFTPPPHPNLRQQPWQPTGLMIASYLVHVGFVQPDFESATQHAESALETFAEQRTKNKKGVTIPSQKRYVGYYQRLLEKGTVSVPQCTLKSITMSPMPGWNDIDIIVKISVNQGEDHYDAKSCDGLTDRRCQKVVKWENLQNLKKPLQLRGDVLITFERTSHFGKNQEFCRCVERGGAENQRVGAE